MIKRIKVGKAGLLAQKTAFLTTGLGKKLALARGEKIEMEISPERIKKARQGEADNAHKNRPPHRRSLGASGHGTPTTKTSTGEENVPSPQGSGALPPREKGKRKRRSGNRCEHSKSGT